MPDAVLLCVPVGSPFLRLPDAETANKDAGCSVAVPNPQLPVLMLALVAICKKWVVEHIAAPECLPSPYYCHSVVRKLLTVLLYVSQTTGVIVFWAVVVNRRDCKNMPHTSPPKGGTHCTQNFRTGFVQQKVALVAKH